jgi:hypothetical protein
VESIKPYRLRFATHGDALGTVRAFEAASLAAGAERAFGPYETDSLFLTVTDTAGDVAGAARLILPGPAGLKTLNDLDRRRARIDAGIESHRTWDLASFAVRAGSRHSELVAAALCHGLVHAARVNRVRTLVATLDDAARARLAFVGLAPAAIPGTERTAAATGRTPMWGYVSELLDFQRFASPEAYRLVVHGIGLEDVSLPSREQLRVTAPVRAVAAGAAVRTLAATG